MSDYVGSYLQYFRLNDNKRCYIIFYWMVYDMNKSIISFSKYVQKRKSDGMCAILEKIKGKTAYELLEEYNIPMKLPIDVPLLLDKIGIYAIPKDFSDIEKSARVPIDSILGAAFSKGDSLAIFYRESDTYNRKIFTIAHELGHCCLHAENLKISHVEWRTIDNIEEEHEINANIFAGELLIPEKLLIEKYEQFIIPSLNALAEIFGVSVNVMAARLDYLNLPYFKDVDIKISDINQVVMSNEG